MAPRSDAAPRAAVFSPSVQEIDLHLAARQQIAARLFGSFPGTALMIVLEGLLRAQGYLVDLRLSSETHETLLVRRPGSAESKLAMHVVEPEMGAEGHIDAQMVRSCHQISREHGVTHSMVVALAGFDDGAHGEAKRLLTVVLRDREAIIDAFLDQYDTLPDEVQGAIPLEWILVPINSPPELE